METLLPVSWGDIATKQDLLYLTEGCEARLRVIVAEKVHTLLVVLIFATIGWLALLLAAVAAVRR